MKIVVIGASNSIIGERGYVGALREKFQVINMSAGDVPIFFTLSKILTRQDEIAQADFVLLDHSISDRLSYFPTLRERYIQGIQDTYSILTSINPNVISVVFPLNLKSDAYDIYLATLHNLCQRLNVHFVNFQPIATDQSYFEDAAHVHCEVSYLMGICLSHYMTRLDPCRTPRLSMIQHPYTVREAKALSPGKPLCRFESSMANADYVMIDDETVLEFESDHQAAYIEYVVLRNDPRWLAMDTNGATHYFGGLDVTGDIVSDDVSSRFVLTPIQDEKELKLPYARGQAITTRYSPMNLVRMIFREKDAEVQTVPPSSPKPSRFELGVFLKSLETLVKSGWFNEVENLSERSAEVIRDHNRKGMVEHKMYFAETVERGNKIRRKRMEIFRNRICLDSITPSSN